MFELGHLKPLLSTLALPPAGPLLLIALGFYFWTVGRKIKLGKGLTLIGVALAWLLSCQGLASYLDRALLKSYPNTNAPAIANAKAQAIVVLGGGMQPNTAEYQDTAQPSATAATRIRYGAWLALQTKLPLAFSGGRGWAANQANTQTEADAAANYLQAFHLPAAKWLDGQASDTADNAKEMALLLQKDDVYRIVLVTHTWHMERAVKLFEARGFTVIPAPMSAIANDSYGLLNWLPSAQGLMDSRVVLREALALVVMRIKH